MEHRQRPWERMRTSEEESSISGEITPLPKKTPSETERAIDTEGKHTVEEWLVFVEEEIGPITGVVKDEIRGTAGKDIVSLPQFTDLLGETMEKKKQIDINILNALSKLDKMSGKY